MSNQGAEGQFDFLIVGLDQQSKTLLLQYVEEKGCRFVSTAQEFEAFTDGFELKPGTTVFVGPELSGMSHMEVGQAANSLWNSARLVFMTFDRAKYELVDLKKNGFQEALLLPMDKVAFEAEVQNAKASKGGIKKRYKAVKVLDLEPSDRLDFEVRVFLPLANKYVLLNNKGTELSEKKFKKLEEQSVNSLFVDADSIEKFYSYSAEKLAKLGDPNTQMSATERSEKMQKSVRQLFQSILDSTSKTADFQQGKDLLEQSHKVVENYIKQKTKVDIKQQIVKLMGESTDAYSHAQSVSTLVCLFSMAFEIGTPEDLAIAGLFHDIGIVGISTEVTPFDYKEKLSPEDQKKYEFHPENSLNLLKEKRITVSPKISEIIEKHHERSDGKGFPKNLPPHKVPLEAQLLRFADLFEYCTRVSAGEKRLSPLEAVEKLNHIGGFSPEIISKARKFFSEVTANAA